MLLFAILAYPLGSFLDWLLGKHGAKRFPKRDLKALIELHKVAKQTSKKNEADVPDTELRIIEKPHQDHRSLVIFFLSNLKTFLNNRLKNQASLKKKLK